MKQRPDYPSHALLSAARTHFSLTQAELARYLGVSAAQLTSVETGRRRFGPVAARRLDLLLDQLPPPVGGGPPLPALPAPAPAPLYPAEAARLRARLRRIRHVAAELADALAVADRADAAYQRRCQGLAALRRALEATAALPAAPSANPDPARDVAWLGRLDATTAAQRRPAPATLAHQALRLRLLQEEAAGLAALLEEPIENP